CARVFPTQQSEPFPRTDGESPRTVLVSPRRAARRPPSLVGVPRPNPGVCRKIASKRRSIFEPGDRRQPILGLLDRRLSHFLLVLRNEVAQLRPPRLSRHRLVDSPRA